MPAICFVLPELFPVTPGGIGKLASNIIDFYGQKNFSICWTGPSEKLAELAAAYREVNFFQPDVGGFDPAKFSYLNYSFLVAEKFQKLELSGTHFDFIEFCDFQGFGFFSTQFKKTGVAFAKSRIVIRLHSTGSIIAFIDKEFHYNGMSEIFDLERTAIRDCDLVVSHVPQIAEFNKNFFQLPEKFLSKVRVEFPPFPEETKITQVKSNSLAQRDFVFPSKIQGFKNPELFVDGAVEFLASNPNFEGSFVFACHDFANHFGALIDGRVPEGFKNRFFRRTLSNSERKIYLRNHICVIPSIYESLNLAAYEVLSSGGTLLLNEDCLAFSDTSAFVDGKNCFKFKGNPSSLAEKMRVALTAQLQGSRTLPNPDSPYWVSSFSSQNFDDENSSYSLTATHAKHLELVKQKYRNLEFLPITNKGVLFTNINYPSDSLKDLSSLLQKSKFVGVHALLCVSKQEVLKKESLISFPGPKATFFDSFERSCSCLLVLEPRLGNFLEFLEDSQFPLSLIESFQVFSEKAGLEVGLFCFDGPRFPHRLPLSSIPVEQRLYQQLVFLGNSPRPLFLKVLDGFSVFNLGGKFLGNNSIPFRHRLVDKIYLAIKPLWPFFKMVRRLLGH